ncbi:MAG TPA: calcium/sodium antiporter [Cryomorphaceae bacterium]|nr:calcium/sodium antiporter [Cryomorphaceae bacterium]
MEFILIVAGLLLLVIGGDYLVKGASGIALKMDVPPMLVGMTVVALGTSSPELVVSLKAALDGKPDISVGNVVGSNIANVALILGITTLIFPLAIQKRALKVDWLVMMIASVIFYLFALDGGFSRFEGGLFVSLLAIFIGVSFYQAKKNKDEAIIEGDVPKSEKGRKWWVLFLFIVLGTIGLILGAQWFLSGAESIARNLGVSDRVIAITLVAFGTSVPELAASVVAAFKKEQDISLGNIVGSNLFNLFAIIGITSIVTPVRVATEILSNDIFWMLGTSFIILPLALIRNRLGRIDGLIFISTYILFVYLLLIAP